MKGVLSLEGAVVYAWIDGHSLLECIDMAGAPELHRALEGCTIFKVDVDNYGELYPALIDGKFAVRFAVHELPHFDWAKEQPAEVEVRVRVDTDHESAFTVPLVAIQRCTTSFRTWALLEQRKWASTPSEDNELEPLFKAIAQQGWMVVRYSVPCGDLYLAAGSRKETDNYVLTIRPKAFEGGELHTVMAPDYGRFLASLKAAVESLDDLKKYYEE